MKKLASQICEAVRSGRLAEPFNAADVRKACPGWADRTYSNFPSKHRIGNPSGTTELFEQVAPGSFRPVQP